MEPELWHITISPYSEKVRWALDFKGIPYAEKKPVPGVHMAVALWLTRGRSYTFPVLEIDGERIGDSTAIIEALERRYPRHPLYPASDDERARALELEEWFDEDLGPYVRRFGFHELINDPRIFEEVGALAAPGAFRRMGAPGQKVARQMIGLRYRAQGDGPAREAMLKVLAGFDRLEAELADRDYLVGDSFSVADLTAASVLYPVVRPKESYVTIDRMPAPVEELRTNLRERRGYQWVEEMYERHRYRDRA